MTSFPDVRWGSETSRLRKPMLAFSATRAGSWMIRTLTPVDRRLLQRTNGRYTVLGPLGSPVMLLTTTGATSGLGRTTPLLYARDGEDLIVVGSNFGQGHHPAWTGNLIKQPSCVVTIGGTPVQARALLLDGMAADAAYQRMVDLAKTYGVYRARTDRAIRVFRLVAA